MLLNCPECAAPDQEIIGHAVQGVYDGVLYWVCSNCGFAWARDWEPGSRQRAVADRLVSQFNQRGSRNS